LSRLGCSYCGLDLRHVTAEGWSHDDTVHFGFKLLEMSREGRALGAAARELVERTTAQVPTLLA